MDKSGWFPLDKFLAAATMSGSGKAQVHKMEGFDVLEINCKLQNVY